MEPITAYRWMHTDLSFGRKHYLYSLIFQRDLGVGWNECNWFFNEILGGFHSFKTPELAIEGDMVDGFHLYDFNVMVEISICGRIYEHALGYRSQYARMEKIVGWGFEVNGRMIRELRDRYDMDVAHINIVDGKKAATLFGLWPLWRKQ